MTGVQTCALPIRRRAHAFDQAQGAQDQGIGEQEVEEAPDGNGVGGVQDVCCCKAAFYFVIMLVCSLLKAAFVQNLVILAAVCSLLSIPIICYTLLALFCFVDLLCLCEFILQ